MLESKNLHTDITLQGILEAAHVTLDDYIQVLATSKYGQSVILKRQPFEQNVNCYSPTILKTWQANMDIHYVIDAYACVMYITSYVLKAEKGMGELLMQAAKELEQGKYKTTTQQAWIGVPHKLRSQCSRSCLQSVIDGFKKMQQDLLYFSTLIAKNLEIHSYYPSAQLQKLNDSDIDIYCKNIIDRYAARPQTLENMSLAEFAANYTYKQERHNNVMEDKDELSGESEREFGDDDNNDNNNSIVQTSVITLQTVLAP